MEIHMQVSVWLLAFAAFQYSKKWEYMIQFPMYKHRSELLLFSLKSIFGGKTKYVIDLWKIILKKYLLFSTIGLHKGRPLH